MKRRIEITYIERKRVVGRASPQSCPVCAAVCELLTTAQAAALVQVRMQSIRRWLRRGQAHGVRTPGGRHRVCRNSLLIGPVRAVGAGRREPSEEFVPDAVPFGLLEALTPADE